MNESVAHTNSGFAAESGNGYVIPLMLLVILVLGALLRFQHLADPIGGYHAMNEAQYNCVARNFSRVSLLKPTGCNGDVDVKVRALYVYTVYAAQKFFGDGPAVARGVSAAAGVISILLIFLIACNLSGTTAGLLAAALLAVSPIHVTLSRNAQPDAMCAAMILLSLWLYLKAARSDRESLFRILSGLAWGAAVFTKNFALLVLPCIIVFEMSLRPRWSVLIHRVALFLLPAIIVLAPFLIYRLIDSPHGTVANYRQMVLSPPDSQQFMYMLRECVWALSPLVFAAAAVAVFLLPLHNLKDNLLVLCLALVFSAQYFFQHVHSYYFLSAAPFLILCAALLISRFRRGFVIAISAGLLITSFSYTLLCLAATKIDFTNFRNASFVISSESRGGTLIASSEIYNNYGLVLNYYLPGYSVFDKENVPRNRADGRLSITTPRPFFLLDIIHAQQELPTIRPDVNKVIYSSHEGVCIFGRVFYTIPFSPHSFIPVTFGSARAEDENGACFGFAVFARKPSLLITRVPDGMNIFHNETKGESPFVIK